MCSEIRRRGENVAGDKGATVVDTFTRSDDITKRASPRSLPPCRATPTLQPSAAHHMIHISSKPYELIAILRRSFIKVWSMSLLGLENRACTPMW
jgi:hypothetical protein